MWKRSHLMAAVGRRVRLADRTALRAERGVICSVTPNQLYGQLLAETDVPSPITESVAAYRYGKGDMQIHYALSQPPRWKTAGLDKVALIHLTPGLDGVSRAANEAERGTLPAVPTASASQRSIRAVHRRARRSYGCNCPRHRVS
jgi:phytoene dehydrogenase-like protein